MGHHDLGDTWVWTAGGWSLAATTGPSPREFAATAYDPSTRRMLLYGGTVVPADGHRGWETPLTDTWNWDGRRWNSLDSKDSPQLRMPEMAYDQSRREMTLLGWEIGNNSTRASFRWTGTGWSRTQDAGPPLTVGFSLTYDPSTASLLVFGGFNQAGTNRDETWLRDSSGWKLAAPAHHPSRTGFLSTSATTSDHGVVLLSGCELWTWDGTDWSQSTTAFRVPSSFLFRTARGELFVLGARPSLTQDTNLGVWKLTTQ